MTRAAKGTVAVLLAAALPGCADSDGLGRGRLSWVGKPDVLRPASLPRDRVLRGVVRNDGLRTLDIVAARLRLLDADGRRVPGTATFLAGFAHGLHPPTREPRLSEAEERRLGRRARIEPGGQVPLTLAWRLPAGRRPPVAVSYGQGRLPIPADR